MTEAAASGDELISIGDVVARLYPQYPDVSPSSLRFLEREGLIVPRRTRGGHRLYSQEDVGRLRRIKEWQRERLSLAEIRARLATAEALPSPERLAAQFLEAALAGRAHDARRVLVDAYDAGLSLDQLYTGALGPALCEAGRRWEDGEITVADEHEVSALARDVVGELAARQPTPQPPRGVAVAACVTGEAHDLVLRMIASLLAGNGYNVHFLGANVPVEDLVGAVRDRRPTLLLLSATMPDRVTALVAALQAIDALPKPERPRVLVGGQGVPAHAATIRQWGAEPAETVTSL
jgi:methanogenic corrinoid protein MtbC1